MTRKSFLGTSLFLGTPAGRQLIAATLDSPSPASLDSPARPEASGRLILKNDNHILEFDQATGRCAGFEAAHAPEQQFVIASPGDPAFVIQYLDDHNEYQQIESTGAQNVKVQTIGGTLTASYRRVGGFDIDAVVTIRMPPGDRYSYWLIALSNRAGIRITDVQFPLVIVSYTLSGSEHTEQLLEPFGAGRLIKAPAPENFEPDSPHAWQFSPENGDSAHYPGGTVAQFLAYWNDRAGIHLSCQDDSGAIKLIKPLHHKKGIRLGISHIGDWPANGERTLDYNVALTAFKGDWYEAAGIYREWSLGQKWG